MKALTIAGVGLRRMARDRTNIFFVVLMPLSLILIFGLAFGGDYTPRLGLVDHDGGPLAARLVAALQRADGIVTARPADEDELRTDVERGRLQAGLVIPAGYGAAVESGDDVPELRYIARPDPQGQQVGVTVRSVVSGEAALLRAARFGAQESAQGSAQGGSFDAALAMAVAFEPFVPRVAVETSTTGTAAFPATLGRFDVGASTQLMLFVFLTSLTAAVALIETRRLGVSRRMLATPTGAGTILFGEALGRVAIALSQGLLIMLGSALLFGVGWGDPLAAGALLVAFSLVGSGAAMVVGAVFRTEQQAGAVGLLFGLGLAALGGSMMPLEFFSEPMRVVAHLTPHAWANDGFAELVRRGGGIADILPELGVLAGYAAALFLLGSWRLRKALTS